SSDLSSVCRWTARGTEAQEFPERYLAGRAITRRTDRPARRGMDRRDGIRPPGFDPRPEGVRLSRGCFHRHRTGGSSTRRGNRHYGLVRCGSSSPPSLIGSWAIEPWRYCVIRYVSGVAKQEV